MPARDSDATSATSIRQIDAPSQSDRASSSPSTRLCHVERSISRSCRRCDRGVRQQVADTQRRGHHDPGREVIAVDERTERRRAFAERLPSPVHPAAAGRVLGQAFRGQEQADGGYAARGDPDTAPLEHPAADDEHDQRPAADGERPDSRRQVDAERQRAADRHEAQRLPGRAIGRRQPIDESGRQRHELQRDRPGDDAKPQMEERRQAGRPPRTIGGDQDEDQDRGNDERRGIDAGEQERRAREQSNQRARAPLGARPFTPPLADSVRSSSCTGSRSSGSSSTCCG